MSKHGVVVFRTTTAAMRSEKVLRAAGYEVKLIDVPRSLSTDCCLGLRFFWCQSGHVQQVLTRERVEFVGVHRPPD
jgi:hypothetical protein